MSHKKLLFLCTGNYHRSRFAEIVFNALAMQSGLPWKADSRGLQLNPANVGPISNDAVHVLSGFGIEVYGDVRFPLSVTESDFLAAQRIIAMKEAEHRVLIEQRFPAYLDQVEYWNIHDLEGAKGEQALAELHARVADLHSRLMNK